jgi:hypothetical protein
MLLHFSMTRDRAIALAREVAMAKGWFWLEPVQAICFRRWWIGSKVWEVISNRDKRGMNVRIVINDMTGQIIENNFFSR